VTRGSKYSRPSKDENRGGGAQDLAPSPNKSIASLIFDGCFIFATLRAKHIGVLLIKINQVASLLPFVWW
jgi:hypothetical protein